ncbi:DUF982 domain-containing protein [Shinella curvata]|uniref:DUF982 domain-containing protein n=1 Tax=Shinella curvata TaxID=1817964 RepID=A0ABT8XN79_9HYPH|nr:DUF982 domain-containing protein [Shinella curvata]MCJ8057310.1 DUF982 domain-containing protein [Shinella curvata]MDO6125203.1 DUF982 domain-containing protein [Shinella curvata]
MKTGRWSEPVTFETLTLGVYRTISSAAEAARVLLEWPVDGGAAWQKAHAACLAVLANEAEPETSRRG